MGLVPRQLIVKAGRVWGGVTYAEPLNLNRQAHNASDDFNYLGIICPQIIFFTNILLDPKEVARTGISKGFMTWFEGSSQILPREQDSGFVLSGKPPYSRPPVSIDGDKPFPLELLGNNGMEEDFEALLFSAEPSRNMQGALTIVLCVWHIGDLMMILDHQECSATCFPESPYVC